MPDDFVCDLTSAGTAFPHFWEHTIGSGHATLALRADWQNQLRRCHNELGFEHVRFHGILSDNMGTLVNQNDTLIYSFYNADQVCDFLLSIGMSLFAELSFMPLTLSSGTESVFHYKDNITPPRDYEAWGTLIYNIVQHWVDRYGLDNVRGWYFEIWNEPNLSAFWTGTREDYFCLYQHAAKAIKKVDASLKVGGPATASNSWIKEFRDFCKKNDVPYDFISTHHYPTDAFGKPGDDTLTQLADSRRSVLQEEVKKAKEEAGAKPVYYTEWSTSSNPFDELHDLPYAASYIIKTIVEAHNYVEGYSYWTFSDIFEENYFSSIPFHGGFGLLNIYGIPKPAYRAYELLHKLGERMLPVQGKHATVDAWIFRKDKVIQILLTNSALPRHPVKTELVKIGLDNLEQVKNVYIERIDDTHSNAHAGWLDMGSPTTLSPEQVNILEAASSLCQEVHLFTFEKPRLLLQVELLPQATALLTIMTT